MKPRQPFLISLLLVLGLIIGVFYMFVQDFSFFSSIVFWATIVISTILMLINESINKLIDIRKINELTEQEKTAYFEMLKIPYFQRLRQSALQKQDDNQEKDLLIDHGFDGIMELDNALPKWWLGLFYICIVYAGIYLISFSFTNFAHADEEYTQDVAQAKIEIDAFKATQPDINLETAVYNPDNIAEGKELFESTCASCHKKDGGGGIGPNLTDDYWINVKQDELFKNVFYMVWNGSKNNASMRAFGAGNELSGREIEKIATFVYDLNKNHKAIGGAASQGEKVVWKN